MKEKKIKSINKMHKILVIEDEIGVIEAVKVALEDKYVIESITDPVNVYNDVLKIEPDLIILDLILKADIDGMDICNMLRRNRLTCNIPIIILTARRETVSP